MITTLVLQQIRKPDTAGKDLAPANMTGQGKQSQATSTLTASAPFVKCVCVCVCVSVCLCVCGSACVCEFVGGVPSQLIT